MFLKKREAVYYFIRRNNCIDNVITAIQNKIDDMTINDLETVTLKFRDRCSFPKKFYVIEIPFSDKVVRKTEQELSLIESSILDRLQCENTLNCIGVKMIASALRSPDVEIEISFALTDFCKTKKRPGLLIYWERI